jgi:hypothetical protein
VNALPPLVIATVLVLIVGTTVEALDWLADRRNARRHVQRLVIRDEDLPTAAELEAWPVLDERTDALRRAALEGHRETPRGNPGESEGK